MQRGFTPLVVLTGLLVIFVCLGGLFYWRLQVADNSDVAGPIGRMLLSDKNAFRASLTPTSSISETANWKTYTNNQYGFSFKYPSELGDPQGNGESFTAYFQGNQGYPYSMIIDVTPGEKSLDEYLIQLDKTRNTTYKNIPIEVAGRNAIQRDLYDIKDFPQIETFIDATPKTIIQILLMSHKGSDIKTQRGLTNQILSTFKFH